ncbi:MAG: NUDIX hydrolase [Magnetococcales bacterium]|nr:NUDIX hydrolase [Magnetococcales bacterium]
MIIRPSACIVRDEELLAMRYSYGGHTRYNLPGGKPDPGETLQDTLVRELQEELAITASCGDLMMVAETHVAERHVLHLIFHVPSYEGEPVLVPENTSCLGIDWIPLARLQEKTLYPEVQSQLGKKIRSGSVQAHRDNFPVYLGNIFQTWF